MATTVTYNGVLIENCVTREFDQELQYDASGTDLIAVRYKLGFEGYIHSQVDISTGTDKHGIQAVFPAALPVQFDRVSQLLDAPRGTFVMRWEGAIVLQATASVAGQVAANTDVDNGPKPRGLSVTSRTPSAVRVRWSVEFMLSGCPGESAGTRKAPHKIINNRWSISEGRDADFFTVRRITGTIRFAEGLSPKHAFIGAIMPGLEKGFKREAIECDVAPNGLEANYVVADRQVHYAAPAPATGMEVTHSYSTNDATTWVDEVAVTLRGSPEADRRALLRRMIQIIDARADATKFANDNDSQFYIQQAVITEHIGEANIVTASVSVRHHGNGTRVVLGNILDNKLGKPLELPPVDGVTYDRTVSRSPALHGYDSQGSQRSPAFLFLLTAYHQDPCGQVKNIYGGTQQSPGEETPGSESTNPYPIQTSLTSLEPGNSGKYSQEHASAMYTFARLSSRYVGETLNVMLPLAKADSNGDTARLASLGAGIGKRIITYDAERVGEQPSIPDMPATWTFETLKGYLLKAVVEVLPPTLTVDGNKRIHRVRVKACYGLNKRPTTENLPVGVLPFTSFSQSSTAFNLGSRQSSTIGP